MNKPYDLAIFDLDGTLLDTSPGILESAQYATQKCGYPALSREELVTFIGPPLKVSFTRNCGCDGMEADRLVAGFRECYRGGAVYNADPYEGIIEVLRVLREHGVRICVATGKMQGFAEDLLAHFGMSDYIDDIRGTDSDGQPGKEKQIRLCVGEHAPGRCVMIGDTEYDARGALDAGVPFLAVRYGFGDAAKMRKYPHIGVAETPGEVLDILLDAY